MLHLFSESISPDSISPASGEPYAEAVSRLASIRHALRLVEPFGGGPASDLDDDAEIAAVWPQASEGKRRCFDARTSRVVGGAAAGIEVLLAERSAGREPHRAASAAMVEEIRRSLEDVSKLMLG
ncbi:MAG: hypothetical protein ABIQ32_07430 [Sphingomicrobium sp.]